jgi:hypothetical protein
MLITCIGVLTSTVAFAQSSGSMGAQAREESTLQFRSPETEFPGITPVIKQNPTVPERDAKLARKSGLKEFLVTRLTKNLERAMPVAITKKVKEGVNSFFYVFMVLLLFLILLNVLFDIIPSITGALILILVVIVIFWLLGFLWEE